MVQKSSVGSNDKFPELLTMAFKAFCMTFKQKRGSGFCILSWLHPCLFWSIIEKKDFISNPATVRIRSRRNGSYHKTRITNKKRCGLVPLKHDALACSELCEHTHTEKDTHRASESNGSPHTYPTSSKCWLSLSRPQLLRCCYKLTLKKLCYIVMNINVTQNVCTCWHLALNGI